MTNYEQFGDGRCHCADCGATWAPFSTETVHRCDPGRAARWRRFQAFEESERKRVWPMSQPCRHPSHNAPIMLYVPPGKIAHVACPGCGEVREIHGSQVHW